MSMKRATELYPYHSLLGEGLPSDRPAKAHSLDLLSWQRKTWGQRRALSAALADAACAASLFCLLP